jgi:DNA-binding CsgD family transcriptional regulator
MSELEIYSELVATIYDAVLTPELWPLALEGIRDFVRGCAANFYWQDASKENAGVFYSVGIEPAYLQSYFQTYAKMNPLYPAAAFIAPGVVFDAGDIVPISELRQTRFYSEWMRPQGMADAVVANLEKSVASVAALAVIRGKREGLADEEARRRMRLIVPHMLRAASIGHLVAEQASGKAALTDTLNSLAAAVVLVDATGNVVFANEAAAILIESGRLLRNGPGGLAAIDPQANRALQNAIVEGGRASARSGARGIAISLSPKHNERWLAHVLPLTSGVRQQSAALHSAATAVFVREAALDIPSPLETVARLYKLTGTEVRVLHAVVETGGVPDIAAVLGISRTTVRTHLKHLFEKTGTRRQADLVKLIGAHASPFRAG